METTRFVQELDRLVGPVANGKGYNDDLAKLVKDVVANHPMKHALGEIIYKVVRYSHTNQVDDILKVGAWAAVVFEQHPRVEVDRMEPQRPTGSGPLPGLGGFSVDKEGKVWVGGKTTGWPGDRGDE